MSLSARHGLGGLQDIRGQERRSRGGVAVTLQMSFRGLDNQQRAACSWRSAWFCTRSEASFSPSPHLAAGIFQTRARACRHCTRHLSRLVPGGH